MLSSNVMVWCAESSGMCLIKHGLTVTMSGRSIVIYLMKCLVLFYYPISMFVYELLVHCVLEMYTYGDIWYAMEFAEELVHSCLAGYD